MSTAPNQSPTAGPNIAPSNAPNNAAPHRDADAIGGLYLAVLSIAEEAQRHGLRFAEPHLRVAALEIAEVLNQLGIQAQPARDLYPQARSA